MKSRARTIRNGLAAIEVVATAAIGLTFGFAIVMLVRMASQRFLEIISLLVGWPLL